MRQKTLLFAKMALLLLLPVFLFCQNLDVLEQKQSFCLFKCVLGHECWGCGLYKATIASLQMDFARAFQYNKLIVAVFPLMLFLWGKELRGSAQKLRRLFSQRADSPNS